MIVQTLNGAFTKISMEVFESRSEVHCCKLKQHPKKCDLLTSILKKVLNHSSS